MKTLTFITLIFLILAGMSSANGQAAGSYHISEEKWLPDRRINCIFQDAEGLLWVGTGSGLYRYDGFRVKHFATHPNRSNTIFTNNVTDLAEAAPGQLLVATESGLSLFTKKNEAFSTLSREIERFNRLKTFTGGSVWVGAADSWMYRITPSARQSALLLRPGVESQAEFRSKAGVVRDLAEWNQQNLLIGTSRGLFRFDPLSQLLKPLGFEKPVEVVKVFKNGRVLVGTRNDGLFELSLKNDTATVVGQYHFGDQRETGHDRITSISEGPLGRVLVSTPRMFYLADGQRQRLEFEAPTAGTPLLEDNNIEATCIDRAGVVWIGTLRGLLKVRPAPLVAERIRIQAPGSMPLNQHVSHLYKENERRYWVNTKDDGVFTFDPLNRQFARVVLPAGVSRVARSEKGYYLAYGGRHVYRFEAVGPAPPVSQVLSSNQNLWSGLEVSPGEWWFGGVRNGIMAYSDSGETRYGGLLQKINREFAAVSTIFVLMRDSEQNIWIGSRGDGLLKVNLRGDGLLKVNLRTGELRKYSGMHRESVISSRILHIKEDTRGRIWVATREGGLYLYDAARDAFRRFTTEQGLPSDVVCAVGEDQNHNIVVSTDNGLAVYRGEGPVAFGAYDRSGGIEFTDFTFNSVAEADNGDIYFGNSNGLYRVRLNELPAARRDGFHWSTFHIVRNDGSRQQLIEKNQYLRQYDPQKGIALAADENSFEVAFSLLNFADPDKNHYAYRLKGHDAAWKYILDGQPQVYFQELREGQYELQVKAADNFGNWSDAVNTLQISVAPPFGRSKLAYSLYAVGLLLLGFPAYGLFRRVKRLKQQLAEETELLALQDQQMIYFSDLSHEIKNRLSMILGPLEKALSGKKVNQAVLNNLYEQTLRLKRISDQIMNLRKSEAGEFLLEVSEGALFAALERLCQETEPLAIVRNVRLRYAFGSEPATAWFDEEVIEIILLNLLNNAIKYTPSGGTVHVKGEVVTLDKSDLPSAAPDNGQYLKCSVSDTGIGIPAAEVKKLFDRFYRASNVRQRDKRAGAGIGLDMVARLIRKHRGIIDIVSQEGDGTRVDFYLPIEKKHFTLNEVKLSGQSVSILEKLPDTPPATASDSRPREVTLLLVDDEPDILEHLDENLKAHFALRLASDGEEAWNILLRESVDLIISDLSMPGIDGLELLQHVRGAEKLKHLPFIVLTGRNSEAQKLTCLQNGVDDFIDKPFSVNLIIWRVRNLIENRQLLRSEFGRKITVEPSVQHDKSANELFIEQVVNLIEKNLKSNLLSVEFLAEECAMSRATFYRKMESLLDQPPSVFIRTYRLKKAAKLLQSGHYYVAEVAYQTGFSNPKYFSKCFQKEFGASPTEYVKTLTDARAN